MERMPGRVLVVVPTYNERENLPAIVGRVRAAVPEAHVLVADDASPDGTGAVADELAAGDDHVHALHRPGKQGLGAAYIAGFRWGMAEGFDVLVEMDADGSHQPEELPKLLERLAGGADLVIGSRWVPGGEVVNWPASREFL
ncbi:glycosyltransferase, partial [Streptosporangium sandarakinum]